MDQKRPATLPMQPLAAQANAGVTPAAACSARLPALLWVSNRTTPTPVRLGTLLAGGSYIGPTEYFSGTIDSVRLYVTALTPAQIQLLSTIP